ncbi:hypothetical protein OFB79_24765, partial [Escherichia coli]|nr:hypothetical protein [Escherichia coli]
MRDVKRRKIEMRTFVSGERAKSLLDLSAADSKLLFATIFRCPSLMDLCSNLDELSSDGPRQPFTSMHLR